MRGERAIVVGAGIGGLVAAAILAKRGFDVTVVERAKKPGGKMRAVEVSGRPIDAGPTVFTMKSLFREIAAEAGFDLEAALTLKPVEVLARHAWGQGERLDLFVDPERSAEAIGDFSGAEEARRFLAFRAEAAHVFRTLDDSFIRAAEPSRAKLVMGAGIRGLADLARIRPFQTLWTTLGQMFSDPRLRQLFGRYATYCGSSPFSAPATLMLVAHVEMDGVWLVDGGMRRVAEAFAEAAEKNGATFRYGSEVSSIDVERGRVAGVTLAGGERLPANRVVFNGDVSALGTGLLGRGVARAAPATKPADRSLSAVTYCKVAKTSGFPLARHTVFFSDAYEAEFADVFSRSRLPETPTTYVCAQDRDDGGNLDFASPEDEPSHAQTSVGLEAHRPSQNEARSLPLQRGGQGGDRAGSSSILDDPQPTLGRAAQGPPSPLQGEGSGAPERLMLLVNAPAIGDAYHFGREEIERCEANAIWLMAQAGLTIEPAETVATSPSEFSEMFPATGGALYGPASHGANASFRRATPKTSLPGLYLCGGSVHPGPGIPMAALSGWRAANLATSDSCSTGRSRPAATPGGTSTPGRTTAPGA